ncbi:MAG: hypothetical protein ACKOBA_10935 [Limnohabitans sp.]
MSSQNLPERRRLALDTPQCRPGCGAHCSSHARLYFARLEVLTRPG